MRTLGLLCLLLAAVALAASGDAEHGNPPAPGTFARQVRMKQVLGLAEALDLNEAEALRMAQIIRGIQERRWPLQHQVQEAARTIKRAAEGDPDAIARVDAALNQMFAARAQLAELNREQFFTLAQGLSPQQRAKMAVYFAKFAQQLKEAQVRRAHRIAAAAQGLPPADAELEDSLELE